MMAVFQRIRSVLGLCWHFRYYFAAAFLALAFWDTLLIKPFRLFMVLVHEVCHAGAALATGGEVIEMRTNLDESGHTLTEGGFFPLISSAGYVGSALAGSMLIYTGVRPALQRLALVVVGAACAGMTLAYTPQGGADFYLGIFGGLSLVFLALKSRRAARAGAVWMGIMLCLYSLHDFRTDLWLHPEMADAGILARYWGWLWAWPLGPYLIALVWVGFSLFCMYRAMRALVRRQGPR